MMFFHETDAQEHDFNCLIMRNVRANKEIAAIMQHHRSAYREDDKSPFFYVVSNHTRGVYGELAQSVPIGNGKYVETTPHITEKEMDAYWRVFNQEVRKTDFKGWIVMDVFPEGHKRRFSGNIK